MNNELLRERFEEFAAKVFALLEAFPAGVGSRVVQHQLAKAGSSGAANYRAAQRARSRAEFAAKLHVAFEGVDETDFWLNFAVRCRLLRPEGVQSLRDEAGELCAILAASQRTARTRDGGKHRND